MRLISSNDIVGHVARWAVQLHPYKRPEGLFMLVHDVSKKCDISFKDGVADLPMRWFGSYQKLLAWLQDETADHPILTVWNTPKSGKADGFASRYGGPKPENDFIDIDALWMNVARCAWDDAAEFEKPPVDSPPALRPTVSYMPVNDMTPWTVFLSDPLTYRK